MYFFLILLKIGNNIVHCTSNRFVYMIVIACAISTLANSTASGSRNSTKNMSSFLYNKDNTFCHPGDIGSSAICSLTTTQSEVRSDNYSVIAQAPKTQARADVTPSLLPDVHPNTTKNSNFKFDEKKREDAFEKKPATENPYAVLLVMFYEKGKVGSCSGSLLTPDWVLTAAHCLVAPENTPASKILVYAGGYSYDEVKANKMPEGAQLRDAKVTLPHPKYRATGSDYDVGLVMVGESFEMSDVVGTVAISARPWRHRGYRTCHLTGFGVVQIGDQRPDDMVRKTHTLQVKRPCLCSYRLKMLFGRVKAGRYLCARPVEDHGACRGDSGGGLVCDGRLWGVTMMVVAFIETYTCEVSFWHGVFPNFQCGKTNTLSIFQDTCPSLGWIDSHTKLFNDSRPLSEECAERDAAARTARCSGKHSYIIASVFFDILLNKTLFAA